VDQSTNDIRDYDLKRRFTAKQLAALIKIQAHFRGFLTRKKIRSMQMNAGIGMGGYTYNANGDIEVNYDNP
jgi:hypothetical protein